MDEKDNAGNATASSSKRIKNRLKNMGLFLLIAVPIMALAIVIHEYNHGLVMASYGCHNITYGLKLSEAYAAGWCVPNETMRLTQDLMDVIMYHITLWLGIIASLQLYLIGRR